MFRLFGFVYMRKNLHIFGLSLILSNLVTSCGFNQTASIDQSLLLDPFKAYSMINNYYKDDARLYYVESSGELVSSRGNKELVKEYKIKDGKNFYSLKSTKSDLFDPISFKRYFNEDENEYAVSFKDESDDMMFVDSDSELDYSTFSFLNQENYSETYGYDLTSITNFIVFEGYEKLSFKDAKISRNSNSEIEYTYTLNLSSKLNGGIQVNEDDISSYSSINATVSEAREIDAINELNNVDIKEASFKLLFDKIRNEINQIIVSETLTIGSVPFTYTYTSNFKTYMKENPLPGTTLPSKYQELINDISSLIESSKDIMVEDLYKAYLDLNKKYKSLNYYTTTESSVEALGGLYSQTVKGFKLKNNDDYFFQTVTTSAFVNKAEQRFENQNENKYMLASGNNPNSNSTIGSCESWNNFEDLTKEEYLSNIGHTMENITNYIVDENSPSKSFINTSSSTIDGKLVYSFEMSVNEDENHIDSTKDYKVEMNHMSNMGLPSFSYSNIEIYLNENDEIDKIIQKEKYKTGGFECSSTMTTYFHTYSDLNEIPNEILSMYNDRIKGEN